ncbi:hypothetical protein Nepgr_033224 [Nepenthes gracilis]|uniref:Uncharacterized protein n=1 Tax=Nepenthes gracilis TaxID=150966 RepID=A0AAD3Y8V4_NEPGR|nr:hypothetical protein Nepgr_033224 [Nepenthes gracilis]
MASTISSPSSVSNVVFNRENPLLQNLHQPLGTKSWVVGMIITLLLPFLKCKWWSLLKLRNEVEVAVEVAEDVADVVEKVAEEAEKVAEEVADHSPEGGRLKEVATSVKNAAKEAIKDAQLAEAAIDKVEEVEKGLKSTIQSVGDEAIKDGLGA